MKIRLLISLFIFLVTVGTSNGRSTTFQCKNYSNDGTMNGDHINLLVFETLSNNGTITSSEVTEIECGKLEGSGKIKGPKVEMRVGEFNFKGTIECDKECRIISKKPINKKLFKRSGKGKFTFKVDPNLTLSQPKEVDIPKFDIPRIDTSLPYSTINNPRPAWSSNPLPNWWNQVKVKDESHQISRIYVQFDAHKTDRDDEVWGKIKKIADDISTFLRFTYRFSKSPMRDLYDMLVSFPYDDVESGKIKGVTCRNGIKIVKPADIKGKMDNDLEYSYVTLAIFVTYDPAVLELNRLFAEEKRSALDAVKLYFLGSRLVDDKGLAKDSIDATFCIFKPFFE